MSPPIGGSASDGSCDAADTIWLSSPMIGPTAACAVGRSRRHRPSAVLGPAIQSTVGSKPDDRHRAAAVGPLGGDDAVADAGEGATRRSARPDRAGRCRRVVRAARRAARRATPGATSVVAVGRYGRMDVRERRQAGRSRRAADDDEPAAARDPAAQRVELLGREARRVGVLPDQAIERRPTPRPGRAGRRRIERHRQRRHAVLVRAGRSRLADDVARLARRRCRRPAAVASCTVNAALVVATRRIARSTRLDLELAPERQAAARTGDRSCRTGSAGRPGVAEAGPSLGAAGEPQLAADRRARCWRAWTSIAIQDPIRACPSEQDVRPPWSARPASRPRAAVGRDEARRADTRQDRTAARPKRSTSDRRARAWRRTAHRTPTDGQAGMDRSKDASAPRKVALGRPATAGGSVSALARSRSKRDLSYDGAVPRAVGQRAAIPRSPCPRSDRSAPSGSTDPSWAIRASWWRRRTTSSGRTCGRRSWLATRRTSSGSTCRPRSPATSPTTAIGARRGPSPPGARMGRCARTRIRRSTSTSRPTSCPGTDAERTQRGFFARLRLEAFGPECGRPAPRADAGRAPGGPLQAAPRDRRQHEPGRRAVRGRVRGDREAPGLRGGGPAGSRGDRRRRRPPSTVGGAGRRRGRPAEIAAGAHRRSRGAARSPSPTGTTATRPRCSTATSAG